MKLYHGSKRPLQFLEPRQAQKGEVDVPEDELLEAIYLTPSYEFALAMAARPDGGTFIDEKEHKISFEKPELFNPEEDIYIHIVDSENIPEQNVQVIDSGMQYVVTGVNQLPILETKNTKSRELLDFYELTNWRENKEVENEITNQFKIV